MFPLKNAILSTHRGKEYARGKGEWKCGRDRMRKRMLERWLCTQ